MSKTQYKWDEKTGKLVPDVDAKENKKGSGKYSKALNKAITNTKKTISIQIAEVFTDSKRQVLCVDRDAGGGATQYDIKEPQLMDYDKKRKLGSDNVLVTISGKPNMKLKDNNGNKLEDGPSYILMHELVGHAIPTISGDTGTSGNAVANENKISFSTSLLCKQFFLGEKSCLFTLFSRCLGQLKTQPI